MERVSLTGLSVGEGPTANVDDVRGALFLHSAPVDESLHPQITGLAGALDCAGERPITVDEVLESFAASGLQASNLGRAAEILRQMLQWRLSGEELTADEAAEVAQCGGEWDDSSEFSWANPAVRARTRATIFLSFTSNMISSGLRDCFVYLAKHRLVDCIVTSAGGIEEDIIKCLGSFVLGSFHAVPGAALRRKGWNRIGNIYVPNENYVKFESWLQPVLDAAAAAPTTPSALIHALGSAVNDKSSLLYWCAKHQIPVFCPNLTDGALGDNLYFYNETHPQSPVVLDVVPDVVRINNIARFAKKTGILILGGGSPKHHVCNANLMRNGADFAVYVNTAQEFDGCDSGASVDEAVSWGKIKADAPSVKVNCDASIAFPLLTAAVFRREAQRRARVPVDFISRSPYAC